ncbi:putative non-specific serine/threonine protein kinase [Rosa chinensis]|uniref:Putative non-specific serine/threonine protein kinase n=2 Tax=Rosa chinensis TaxID=74649 RepID=A0A2P6PVD9_ROSCH|nr:putative non-specific serine/threonine protein kinase [Rosa chinensis]
MLVSKSKQNADHHVYDLELPMYATSNGRIGQPYNSLSFYPPAIYLGYNSIHGSIPIEIGQLDSLHQLGLDHNNFTGNIPGQISNLKDLFYLDLSVNHLSGEIPSTLTSLNFLSFINISYNNLEGQIPTGTQFQGFDVSAFEGNPELCGLPLPNECQALKGFDQDVDKEHQIPWFYVSAALGFIVGFWGVCGSLIFNKTWRYAYFRFLENVQDMFYVMMAVRITKMKRRLNAN